MAYASLREFIESLERDGELVRVSVPVRTALEITESSASDGPRR